MSPQCYIDIVSVHQEGLRTTILYDATKWPCPHNVTQILCKYTRNWDWVLLSYTMQPSGHVPYVTAESCN